MVLTWLKNVFSTGNFRLKFLLPAKPYNEKTRKQIACVFNDTQNWYKILSSWTICFAAICWHVKVCFHSFIFLFCNRKQIYFWFDANFFNLKQKIFEISDVLFWIKSKFLESLSTYASLPKGYYLFLSYFIIHFSSFNIQDDKQDSIPLFIAEIFEFQTNPVCF